MEVNAVFLKVLEFIALNSDVAFEGNVTILSEVQSANTPLPNDLIELGMVISAISVLLKAFLEMVVRLVQLNITEVSFLFLKAPSLILVTFLTFN